MSPRIKILRKVLSPPVLKGFKPFGLQDGMLESEKIVLLFEEYEALRLCDYDNYNHHQASEIMGVSRPTFTRIYASTRQKIAKAFVEGRQISIEGGKVYFDSNWYHCAECSCHFNNPEKQQKVKSCPLCGCNKVRDYGLDTRGVIIKSCDETCVCPQCGLEESWPVEVCNKRLCPECNVPMKLKRSADCKIPKL